MKNINVGLIIVAIVMFIGLVVLMDTKTNREKKLSNCLIMAEVNYENRWNSYCEVNNIKLRDGKCFLPFDKAQVYDNQLKTDKELCLSRYK